MRSARRHDDSREGAGFTIVELLVSISIIGLLIALLMPAVQSARESSRKVTCRNNLHQFGVAIHAFEATHREFPQSAGVYLPAVNRLTGKNGFAGSGYSIHAQLLSYLDQAVVANSIDLTKTISGDRDPRASRTQELARTIPVFQCPSEGSTWGTSYRVCTGGSPQGTFFGDSVPHSGVFGIRDGHTHPSDITDGLSNTIMLSEKLHGNGVPGRFSPYLDFWYSGVGPLFSTYQITADQMLSYCETSSSFPPSYPFAGYDWMVHHAGFTTYNHVATPNRRVIDCSDKPAFPGPDGISFGASPSDVGSFRATSSHSGGVFTLTADGAVSFVSDNIDTEIWRAMATISRGD